jgi:DNA-binding NtrC family response regulator
MVQHIQEAIHEGYFKAALGNILIVDEDTKCLQDLAILFEARGFAVSQCRLFESGIRLIEREKFALVVVDQGSSRFEGQLLLRYLHQYQPATPGIIVSRSPDPGCYLRAMELGAADYLEKPLSISDVDRLLNDYAHLTNDS